MKMKYIKTFESKNMTYEVDDYVMILTKRIERKIDREYSNSYEAYKQIRIYLYAISNDYKNNIGKIVDVDSKYPTTYYNVEFSNGRTWRVTDDEIKRVLTLKEIEKYEAQKNANKYNI